MTVGINAVEDTDFYLRDGVDFNYRQLDYSTSCSAISLSLKTYFRLYRYLARNFIACMKNAALEIVRVT